MTWEHADYIVLEGTDKIERLRLHIVEVAQALRDFTARSGADGWSFTRQSLDGYLRSLKDELEQISPSIRPTSAFIGLR